MGQKAQGSDEHGGRRTDYQHGMSQGKLK